MSEINPGALVFVAQRLDAIGLNYAFVGGSIVSYLVDYPDLSPVRPTEDLDIIVEVLTTQRYSDIEHKLRAIGFQHDTRQGAPMCRWILSGLTIDIMPTEGGLIGLNTAWFAEALASAKPHTIEQFSLKIISPVAFIATKLAAFSDRGKGDYFASHDLEDLMTVIDGRESIATEIASSPTELRQYIVSSLEQICQANDFQEALPGYLPSDSASQRRLPLLRRKLTEIVALQNQ
jgi:hypothetical protein